MTGKPFYFSAKFPGKWYHFRENAWSWDDKNGKNNRHSEAGVVCGPVTKLPPSRV